MFKWRGVLGEEREVSLNGVVFWMRRWGIFKWRGVLDEGMCACVCVCMVNVCPTTLRNIPCIISFTWRNTILIMSCKTIYTPEILCH